MAAKKANKTTSTRIEITLDDHIDRNGICKLYSHDHSPHTRFENIPCSIDIISELIEKRKSRRCSKYDIN
jgi:hypothetical protein